MKKSLYKSVAVKEKVINLYHKKLKELNIDYNFVKVNTSFGMTNVIKAGEANKPPLVLVHGANGCAPIALEVYPNLTKKYQVFSVDVLGEPNLSNETRLNKKDNSFGKWLNEVINKLAIEEVTLVGFSLGGLVIWKTLLDDESKIKEAFLIASVGIVNGNPLKGLFKIFIPMKRYIKSGNPDLLKKFIDAMFSEQDDFAFDFLGLVVKGFNMDFSPIPLIKYKEAKNIKTPITIIGAENDIMFPGQKMIKRAKKIFPSLKKMLFLENSKHVQSREDNDRIEELILGG